MWRPFSHSRLRRESELREEIESHLAIAARERMEWGESSEAARQGSLREFGNRTLIQEETREAWGWTWMEHLAQDLRYALRQVRRAPGTFTSAVLLIALGVAASTQVFAFVDAVLLRNLPVRDPQSLVQLFEIHPRIPARAFYRSFLLRLIREQSSTITSAVGQAEWTAPVQHGGTTERAHPNAVTNDYFSALGVPAALGRVIGGEDQQVAVLSHGYWIRAFGGDPKVVGQTIRLYNRPFVIIGVAARDFVGTVIDSSADLWFPQRGSYNLADNPAIRVDDACREDSFTEILGRLRPGVSISQAQAELLVLFNRYNQELIRRKLEDRAFLQEGRLEVRSIARGTSPLRQQSSTALWLLLAGTGLVLVMVCADIGGLLLAKASAREKETAVRLAIGASRGRIARMWFIESLLLAVTGGLLGTLLAYSSLPLMTRWLPPARGIGFDPAELRIRALDLSPDLRVLAFSIGVCALVAVLVVGPLLQNGQITERSTLSGDIEVDEPPDVYLPFQIDPNSASHGHFFNVAGRLKPGVTLAAANAQLQATYQGYAGKWPGDDYPGSGFGVQPLQDVIVRGVRNSLVILLGAVGLVLLIACANVANLLLARATDRKREMAIRVAMGAGSGRIIRQLLTESVMLALTGGVLGLAAGYAGIRALLILIPGNIPRIGTGGSNVGLDWRVLGFTMGLSVLTGIMFGLVPALELSDTGLSSTLKESSHRGGTGLRHNRARSLLVTAEMALALVLLIGAALLIRSFLAIRQVNPGFDTHRVLTMRMSLMGPQFTNPASVAQVIREGLRRIRALPGVETAAATCCVPLEDRWQVGFQIVGRPEGPTSEAIAGSTRVSTGYFETFKIPFLRGRIFTEADEIGPPVIIINQTLARRFWPSGDPLRDQIILNGDETRRQIVGVVGDVRDDFLNREPRPNLYAPSVTGGDLLAWVIRTRITPLSLSSSIQNELRQASGGLPVARIRSMEEIRSRSTATENFNMIVLTIFGCSALLLAAIGIYGLMAYSVAQRAQEIGIRLALGAESSHIRNMVVSQGLRLTLAGVVCGLVTAFGLTRLIAGFLFGVKAWDPLVFFVVPVILVGVALIAVWLPAMRASRVDPIHALRYE